MKRKSGKKIKQCKINKKTNRCSLKGTEQPEDCIRHPETNRCVYSDSYRKRTKKKPIKKKKTERRIEEDENIQIKFKKMCTDVFPKDKVINFKKKKAMECLRLKEFVEKDNLRGDDSNILYPNINDPNFNMKIAHKKEFNDAKYEDEVYDVEEASEKMCQFKEFELAPHQRFVRNFLSFQTPYNSLLLFHGLGTGKTCSAILVCEEMRHFNKQMGINKKIIIVASPNVQDNFRLQLFDPRKLKNIEGNWTMQSCTSDSFINEVNPMKMMGFTKEKIVRQIKRIINNSYHFMGYSKFSNFIKKKLSKYAEKNRVKVLKKLFSNRLIVIDEVHNIRSTEENKTKGIVENLKKVVYHVDNLKLLLLSATPMFNSYKEIIWLLNLMNLNDRRFPIKTNEIFDINGNFVQDDDGNEIGKDLLIQKANGYISFVSGDNPYTFPYRVLPSKFLPKPFLLTNTKYPNKTVDGRDILDPILRLDLVINDIGSYQERAYHHIINKMKTKFKSFEDIEKGLGYQILEPPLQILNMAYPSIGFDDAGNDSDDILYGKEGLKRIMKTTGSKKQFEYKPGILTKYGKIFSEEEIGKYSSKINFICQRIRESEGIVLIYSQYIDGGCVPLALALEEMGFRRYGDVPSLFKKKPTPTNPLPFKFLPSYTMITGDVILSPNNNAAINMVTNDDNTNGEKIKVVIISRAASEGIDLKNIRQIHILDPWYNLNRTEQILGRGIRHCSHKALPFKERNVEIYMYGTRLSNKNYEAVDLYIYRLAEKKAIQIGKITRVLKENAVDCILNAGQTGLTIKKMKQDISQHISSGKTIAFHVGYQSYTSLCDYMKECAYTCRSSENIRTINMDTYGEDFIIMNLDMITQIIRNLFKEKYFYEKSDLINQINYKKTYPEIQINTALNQLINDKNLYITDMLNRIGYLINIGDFYMFQPIEIDDKYITRFDRTHPTDYKRKDLLIHVPKKTKKQKEEKIGKRERKVVVKSMEDIEKFLTTPTKVPDGFKPNWYQLCYYVFHGKLIKTHNFRIKKEMRMKILKYGIHHFIDSMNYNQKIILLNILYNIPPDAVGSKIYFAKEYFDSFKVKTNVGGKNIEGLLLNDNNNIITHIFDKKKKQWRQVTYSESLHFSEVLLERSQYYMDNLNKVIGFIGNTKSKDCSEINCFKIVNRERTKDRGAMCDNKSKKDVIYILNDIIDDSKPIGIETYKTTDKQRMLDSNGKREIKINQPQLCCELELIMRYYAEELVNGKIWFLSLVDAVLCKIVK